MLSNAWAAKNLKNISLVLFLLYLSLSYATSIYFVRETELSLALKRYLSITFIAICFYVVWRLLSSVHKAAYTYANVIRGSKEQPALLALAQGTLGLFISLTITAFINIVRIPAVGESTYKYLTIALFYGSGFMAMYYFYFIGKAGYILTKYVKRQNNYKFVFLLFLGVISVVCALIWQKITNQAPDVLAVNQILNYLPAHIVLYTLLIPLIFSWAFGLSGAYGFYAFLRHNKGIIYKHAFVSVCVGVVSLVVMSVSRHMTDYLSGTASQATLHDDFLRIIALFGLAIFSILCIHSGLLRLLRIEKVTK